MVRSVEVGAARVGFLEVVVAGQVGLEEYLDALVLGSCIALAAVPLPPD